MATFDFLPSPKTSHSSIEINSGVKARRWRKEVPSYMTFYEQTAGKLVIARLTKEEELVLSQASVITRIADIDDKNSIRPITMTLQDRQEAFKGFDRRVTFTSPAIMRHVGAFMLKDGQLSPDAVLPDGVHANIAGNLGVLKTAALNSMQASLQAHRHNELAETVAIADSLQQGALQVVVPALEDMATIDMAYLRRAVQVNGSYGDIRAV